MILEALGKALDFIFVPKESLSMSSIVDMHDLVYIIERSFLATLRDQSQEAEWKL